MLFRQNVIDITSRSFLSLSRFSLIIINWKVLILVFYYITKLLWLIYVFFLWWLLHKRLNSLLWLGSIKSSSINNFISKDLVWWLYKLSTGITSLTLPAISSNFDSTWFSRTKNVSSVSILFINPVLLLNEKWSTLYT